MPRRTLRLLSCAVTVAAGCLLTTTPASATPVNPAATAIRFALGQLGHPYKWGGEGPKGYDCSGLAMAAYQSAGIAIPRVAADQYHALTKVPLAQAQPGDLLFWGKRPHKWRSVYHVAIYLGNDTVVQAIQPHTRIQITPLWTGQLMPQVARPAGMSARPILPLRRHQRGDAVTDLQLRLRANGQPVALTGVYDHATAVAVTAIQQQQVELAGEHGYVGPLTWGWLISNGVLKKVS